MDRKQFLKCACSFGVCGCAVKLLGFPEILEAGSAAPDQQLAFARYQLAKMVGFMETATTAPEFQSVLEKSGRECAKLSQSSAKFKADPEGYFDAAKQAWGTDFTWDKAKRVITVAVAEGPCGCPLVDNKRTPAFWCNCSVGYQKETFEAIFGKPVQVSLKESKLRGGRRCVFEVTVA